MGVRGRIAAAVAIGLLQVAAGIARLALLGWLLARVLQGASLASIAPLALLTAAVIVVRGGLEYARTMMAHRTAALVQEPSARQVDDQTQHRDGDGRVELDRHRRGQTKRGFGCDQ